jgi:uncharacterized protein
MSVASSSDSGNFNNSKVEPFVDDAAEPAVRGFLHTPALTSGDALALTHGAGSNCGAPLLVAAAEAFANSGVAVLRFDLPYRQARPHGPPRPGDADRDREGIRRAIGLLDGMGMKRLFLGGHSYGGRQATMVAAEGVPRQVSALLLLSYPLHPPRKPLLLRTAHLPKIKTPAMFVHGSRDPFGTLEEMEAALKLIPARTKLFPVEGAGHDLRVGRAIGDLPGRVVRAFLEFASS